jgi:hypothetical protein
VCVCGGGGGGGGGGGLFFVFGFGKATEKYKSKSGGGCVLICGVGLLQQGNHVTGLVPYSTQSHTSYEIR